MNFQLFKTAQMGTKVAAPRIGDMVIALRFIVAPSYVANEPERPELHMLAEALADHYMRMPEDTRLFSSFRSKNPLDVVNRDIVRFKASEIRAIAESITESSVELSDSNVRALIDIVIQAAIYSAWISFTSTNLKTLLLGGAEGLAFDELIKVAAEEEDSPTDTDDMQRGGKVRIDRGRNKVRYANLNIDPENASASQGLGEAARLAYNCAFHALTTSAGMPLDGFYKPRRAGELAQHQILRQNALGMMVHRMDYCDFLSQCIQNHKDTLASGERPFIAGNPITPNPVYATLVGAVDHSRHRRTSDSDRASPSAAFVLTSLGQSEDALSALRSRDMLKRTQVFGKEAKASRIYGSELSIIGAHKRAGSLFNRDPDTLKKSYEEFLVKGMQQNLLAIKVNGVHFSRYEEIIPSLARADVQARVRAAMARIVSGMPTEATSLLEIAQAAQGLVDKEAPGLAFLDAELPATSKNIANNFAEFAAQMLLKVPLHMSSQWAELDIREALSPIPDINASRNIQLGAKSVSLEDALPRLMNNPKRARPEEVIYNLFDLAPTLSNTKNLFIVARRVRDGDPAAPDLKELLKEVYSKISRRIGVATAEASKKIAEVSAKAQDMKAAEDTEGLARFVAENQKELDILEGMLNSAPAEMAKVLFKEAMLSIGHATSIGEQKIAAAADNFVAGNYEKSIPVLAQVLSESFPSGKYNSSSISQVDSDYNSFSIYENLDKKYRMGPGAGKYDHFGNSGAPIPPSPRPATASIMYECSEHFKVDQLEREHVTAEYSHNKKAHEDYVARNYPVNPDISADPARIEDIEKKCDELLYISKKSGGKADNIINKLGLGVLLAPPAEFFYGSDIDDRGLVVDLTKDPLHAGRVAALAKAKKDLLNRVQDFFKAHSKSSIVELLKQTPNPSGGNFDEFYYDALMVAISRKISTLFDSDFEAVLLNRYGRKEIGSAAEDTETERAGSQDGEPGEVGGADPLGPLGAEMFEEGAADPAARRGIEVEDSSQSQFSKMKEAAEYSAIAGSRVMAQADNAMVKDYVSMWANDISFARSGRLASHSLPGFIAEVLGKKDALSDEGLTPEERKSIESHLRKLRLLESPAAQLRPVSDKLSYRHVPIFAHMKHRARLSMGNQLFYKKANSSLSRLLQSNKESIDPAALPLDRKSVVGRLMQKSGINFIDPVHMARKLAGGDRIGDNLELAFSRMLTSMGDLMIDEDYDAWERAALEYISKVYRRKLERKIDSLAVQVSDRGFLKDLMTKIPPTIDLRAPFFSAGERARLAGIGAGFSKPRSTVSATAFFNATRSADFTRIVTKLGLGPTEHDSARKIIESSTEYRQAFEFEASTGVSVGDALETALTMLGGPAFKKDFNVAYIRSTASLSKYALDKLLRMPAILSSIDTWKKEKESKKRSPLGKTMANMSMDQLVAEIRQSSDVLAVMEASLKEAYGDEGVPDFNSPSDIRLVSQDLIAAVDAAFDPVDNASGLTSSISSIHYDVADVAEADGDDQHSESLLSYSIGTDLGSLIGQECADNAQVAMLMQAVIPTDVLAKRFTAKDAAEVKALASEFRLDHPRIKEMIESATDVKLSRPENILTQRFKDKLKEEGITSTLRRSVSATEVTPMYGSLLSSAKSKIEEIVQQILAAEANAADINKIKSVAAHAVADGGAGNLLGKGLAIIYARTVLDSIRADNKTMYQSFADNLDRRIAEWTDAFSSKFPKLEQVAVIAIRKGAYYAGLSSDEINIATGTGSVPETLQRIVDVRIDVEKKKEFISGLRKRISSAPLPGTIDMLSWQIELKKIEEAAQKEIVSSFPISSSRIVTEQMQESSVDQDDEKSVDQDEIRRREAALDKIKLSVDRMRNRALKADKVPDSTRADAVNAATMLFKTLISGRKTAVDAYDSQKLEDINSAIMRASSDLDSMDKALIGAGNSSTVARLVAAIDDDSVIDASVYGVKVLPKARVEPKKPDMTSFAREIAMAKSEIERAVFKASADKDPATEASGYNALAFISMFDQVSELSISDTASIENANRAISSLLRDFNDGREINETYLRSSLENIAQSGITSKRRLPDYIEIARGITPLGKATVEEDVVEVFDEMADFDKQLDRISRLLPETAAYLSAESQAALGSAIAGLSSSNRTVAPDADIARATKELKVLENALRARYDLRPHQVETLVVGLSALGIEAREAEPAAPLAQPPAAQSGAIAPDEEGVMEIKEEDFSEIAPQAPISQEPAPAEAEQGPLEVSEEEVTEVPAAEPDQGPLEVSEEDVTEVPVPAPKAISEVTYEELRSIILRAVTSAKTAGAAGDAVSKLSHLVDRLSMAMPPPTADEVAFRAQMGVAIERAKTVLGLVAASVGAPTWTRGSELPHMPELDALMGDIDKLMSPQRRAARAVRFVKIGDSWMI